MLTLSCARVRSVHTLAPQARNVSFFLSRLRKDAKDIIIKHSPLERALFQKAIFEELSRSGPFLSLHCSTFKGSLWTKLVFLRSKKSRNYINSLILYELVATQASRPEWRGEDS
jgi:hypothetical protein